jgi:hypothetical protein
MSQPTTFDDLPADIRVGLMSQALLGLQEELADLSGHRKTFDTIAGTKEELRPRTLPQKTPEGANLLLTGCAVFRKYRTVMEKVRAPHAFWTKVQIFRLFL